MCWLIMFRHIFKVEGNKIYNWLSLHQQWQNEEMNIIVMIFGSWYENEDIWRSWNAGLIGYESVMGSVKIRVNLEILEYEFFFTSTPATYIKVIMADLSLDNFTTRCLNSWFEIILWHHWNFLMNIKVKILTKRLIISEYWKKQLKIMQLANINK